MKCIKQIWLVLVVVLCLVGCSKEEISYRTVSQSDIVGVWNCIDGIFEVDQYIFNSDGTGLRKYGTYEGYQIYKDKLEWRIEEDGIIVKGESFDYGILKIVRNGENITLYSDGYSFVKEGYDVDNPNEEDSPGVITPEENNKFDQRLVGEWWQGDVLDYLKQRFFRSDGTGYEIYSRHDEDYGVQYFFFTWSTRNNIFSIQYNDESEPIEWTYNIEGSKVIFEKNGTKYEWNKMNSDEDMSFSESDKPFANNYIKYKVTGYYYKISKVVSGCEHAGPGSNMNERFLHFFGSDGNLNPTGLRIFYHTPSWEGIDSKWYAGTYVMSSSSGAWKYYAMGWCNGRVLYIYEGGVLKIATNQSYTIYDFDDDEVELHVVVEK